MTKDLEKLRKKMDMLCISNIKLCTGVAMDYNGVVYNELENNDSDTEVKIPNGATEIGPFAFTSHMIALERIELPSTIKVIRESAFENSNVEELYIPGSVEQIGAYAFNGTKLNTLVIEKYSNLKIISAQAFSNCKLEVLELPEVYGEINKGVFKQSKINKVVINAREVNIGTVAFGNAEVVEIENKCGAIKSIGYGAFSHCKYLKHIDLIGTQYIEEEAFLGCKSLNEIILDNAVEIQKNAFRSSRINRLRTTANSYGKISIAAFDNCIINRLEATKYYYELLLNNISCKINEYILIE